MNLAEKKVLRAKALQLLKNRYNRNIEAFETFMPTIENRHGLFTYKKLVNDFLIAIEDKDIKFLKSFTKSKGSKSALPRQKILNSLNNFIADYGLMFTQSRKVYDTASIKYLQRNSIELDDESSIPVKKMPSLNLDDFKALYGNDQEKADGRYGIKVCYDGEIDIDNYLLSKLLN